jgi:hypothetical protein
MGTAKMSKIDDDMAAGAKAIAAEYWGDESYFRRIYVNVEGLPIFRYRGQLCAFKTALAAHREAIRAQKSALRARMEKAAATCAKFLPNDATA